MQNVIPYTSISYWTKNTKNTKNTNEQPNTYCNAQSFIWSLKAGMLNRNFKKTVRWVMASDKAYNLMNSIKRIPTYWKKFMHELMEVVKELKGSDHTSWDPIFFLTLSYGDLTRNNMFYVIFKVNGIDTSEDEVSGMSHALLKKCQYLESQQTFVLMKTSLRRLSSSSSEDVFKTSWSSEYIPHYSYVFRRRIQDVFIKTNIFVSVIRLQDVLQKRLQDTFKTSSRRLAKMSSRPVKDVSLN